MGRPRVSEEEYARRIKERFPLEDFEILQYESLGQQAVLLCKQCQNKIEVSKATNFLAKNKCICKKVVKILSLFSLIF